MCKISFPSVLHCILVYGRSNFNLGVNPACDVGYYGLSGICYGANRKTYDIYLTTTTPTPYAQWI